MHDTIGLTLPTLRERTLPCGMRLYIYDRCDAEVNYLSVVTPRGQAEAHSPAMATLTSIMQREGSADYSGEEIAGILDHNGAWLAGSPFPHHTRHSIYSLNDRLRHVMPVFTDMVFRPVFPEKAIEMRREALARNIEVSQSDVNYMANCLSDAMIMGADHPLATIDTPDSIRSITADRINRFHASQFATGDTRIYLCGNITHEIEETVVEAFSDITVSTTESPLEIRPFTPVPAGSRHITHMEGATQSAVVINLPAIPRTHPHYLPLHLTVTALGGYFGSRLMTGIREEKGLTYGIRASLMGYADGAHTEISANTDNATVEMLIEEIRSELMHLSSDPCRGDELLRLRRAATASMLSVLDNPFGTMDYHITMLTSAIPSDYFEKKMKCIKLITPDMISEMASLYLRPDMMRISIAGDRTKMKNLQVSD